jgi:hypothetical protein
MSAKRIKIGRNDRCPCGSGKKFKKCHAGSRAPMSETVKASVASDPTPFT